MNEQKIKLVVENITCMNDGQHSWQERYDYNMKMVKSLFEDPREVRSFELSQLLDTKEKQSLYQRDPMFHSSINQILQGADPVSVLTQSLISGNKLIDYLKEKAGIEVPHIPETTLEEDLNVICEKYGLDISEPIEGKTFDQEKIRAAFLASAYGGSPMDGFAAAYAHQAETVMRILEDRKCSMEIPQGLGKAECQPSLLWDENQIEKMREVLEDLGSKSRGVVIVSGCKAPEIPFNECKGAKPLIHKKQYLKVSKTRNAKPHNDRFTRNHHKKSKW